MKAVHLSNGFPIDEPMRLYVCMPPVAGLCLYAACGWPMFVCARACFFVLRISHSTSQCSTSKGGAIFTDLCGSMASACVLPHLKAAQSSQTYAGRWRAPVCCQFSAPVRWKMRATGSALEDCQCPAPVAAAQPTGDSLRFASSASCHSAHSSAVHPPAAQCSLGVPARYIGPLTP